MCEQDELLGIRKYTKYNDDEGDGINGPSEAFEPQREWNCDGYKYCHHRTRHTKSLESQSDYRKF